MLIDTRDLPPEPGEPARHWAAALLVRLRWFLVVSALVFVSYQTEGWLSVGLMYASLFTCVWRGLKAVPTIGGMKDYSQ